MPSDAARKGPPPDPMCPIRLGEPCNLCESGATGPADCTLVYLVMCDRELRTRLHEMCLEWQAEHARTSAR